MMLLLSLAALGAGLGGGYGDGDDAATPQDLQYRQDALEPSFLEDPLAVRNDRRDWYFSATPRVGWIPSTDFSDDAGELETLRGGFNLGAIKPLSDRHRIALSLGHERSSYSFDGSNWLGVEEPFEDGSISSLSVSLITRESENFRWSLTASARLGMEEGADTSDSTTWFGGGTVTFPFLENLLLTVGGFVTTRLEDDPFFIPWFQLEWQINERLRLGREGGGIGLGYRLADNLHTYGAFSFNVRQFRLDDRGPFPEGVVRDDEFGFNFGAVWNANPGTRVEGTFGIAQRKISVLDGDETLDQQDLDPAPRFGVSVSFRF